MSKISKSVRAFREILRNPWLLNKVLDADVVWKRYVDEKFGLAGGFPVVRPEELFGDFSETVSPYAFLDGGSKPTDHALLKKLARTFPECSYFEIGTWRGESVANVAQVAKECYTLNLSKEEMTRMRLAQGYIAQHGMYSRHLSNVSHLEGNTKNYDFGALNRKFDLVFIDGDHHFKMVKNDTRKVFESLVHDRSIVVWHDYARNQEQVRFEVMAGILEGCPEPLRKNIRHVAYSICAVYFPDDHPGVSIKTLSEPEGFFTIRLDYRKSDR